MTLCGEMLDEALSDARAVQEDAARLGFDWPDITGVFEVLQEEIGELAEAIDEGERKPIEHELGDVLFSVVNLSRFAGACPSETLTAATRRFEARFQDLQSSLRGQGRAIEECTPEELDEIWEQVKRRGSTKGPDDR